MPAGWAPTLNYKDPVFGSSQGFYDAFKQARTLLGEWPVAVTHTPATVNRTPDITDIFALHAVTAFKVALETADSKDPSLVQQALVRGMTHTIQRSDSALVGSEQRELVRHP